MSPHNRFFCALRDMERGFLKRMRNYIGSVRFFKNLILLIIIILIAIPTFLSISWRQQLSQAQQSVLQLTEENAQLSAQLSDSGHVQELSAVPESVPNETFQADAPSYVSLYPDFYAPEPIPESTRTDGMIYLTFDDGPSPRTPEVLEILKQQNIKATFFVVGHDDEQSRQWMRDIVAQGHTLAMHSYTHDFSTIYNSVEDYLDDIYRLFVLIRDTTGITPTLFRCPGGSLNSYNYGIYQEILAEMLRRGFIPFDWNLSNQDTLGVKLSVDQLVSNVVDSSDHISRGIVLMHDAIGKHNTVSALSPTIDQLRAKGFQFDRLTPQVTPILFSYIS